MVARPLQPASLLTALRRPHSRMQVGQITMPFRASRLLSPTASWRQIRPRRDSSRLTGTNSKLDWHWRRQASTGWVPSVRTGVQMSFGVGEPGRARTRRTSMWTGQRQILGVPCPPPAICILASTTPYKTRSTMRTRWRNELVTTPNQHSGVDRRCMLALGVECDSASEIDHEASASRV
jgi:hypothetical protein